MKYRFRENKNIMPINPPCKKTIYHTKEEAEDIIRHHYETKGGRDLKPYQCSICGFWHLTSKTN